MYLLRFVFSITLCYTLKLDICYSPMGKKCVSREDQPLIQERGLAVVDCSWAGLKDVPFAHLRCGAARLCKFINW